MKTGHLRVEHFHELLDSNRIVGAGAHSLRVFARVKVLYSYTERLAIVLCEAATNDDCDHAWLPPRSRFLWEDVTYEATILLLAEQVRLWGQKVTNAIPAGFLAPEAEGEAS